MARRGRSRRSLVLAVQLLLVATFLLAMGFFWQRNTALPGGIPERLAGLPLVSHTAGPQAMAQVAQLHGKAIELANAHIAEYGRGQDMITVWVGEAANTLAAMDLLDRMVEGIKKGTPAFSGLEEVSIDGTGAYVVQGQGQKHYFYTLGSRVIWMAVGEDATPIVVAQAMGTLNTKVSQGY